MKCSNCKVEMEKGGLFNHGMVWQKRDNRFSSFAKWLMQGLVVTAYRCPSCKMLLFKTDE